MRCVSAGRMMCIGLAFAASRGFAASSPAVPTPSAAAATPAGAAAATVGNPVPAVWKERHVDFVYRGRTARYSCEGLRNKVRAMLIDLGARRDVKIVAIGCEDNYRLRVSQQPRLGIVFSSPALPDSSSKPLHAGDLAATDARFETFTITSDAFRNMGIGDCELVEEFARQILPKLVTRDVRRDIKCVPYQPSGSRFLVHGEILKTLPRAEQSSQQLRVR
jgi:hypothetical protein